MLQAKYILLKYNLFNMFVVSQKNINQKLKYMLYVFFETLYF